MADVNYYFEKGVLVPQDAERSGRYADLYSRYLRIADAPSLSCGNAFDEAYRLVYIPDYHSTAIVTIGRSGTTWTAARVVVSPPRVQPMAITDQQRAPVSAEQVEPLKRALESARFWTTPAWKEVDAAGPMTLIEGQRASGYHAVGRIGPVDPPDEAFFAAVRLLFTLVGLPVGGPE